MNDDIFEPLIPSESPVAAPEPTPPRPYAPAKPQRPAEKPKPPEPSGNARPLPAEEQQEIAQLLESLGGPTAGRVKLSLRRHEKGRGWRSLPPLEIEPWQFTDGGFDLEEAVGQQYGDGKFAWILRYRGRFLRRGDLNVVGYGEVEMEDIEPPEAPAPVDLSDVVTRLKAEILGELKPLVQNRESDSTRLMYETMLRLIESKLNREPPPAPKPQGPDPIIASLITAMSAQTTSFMQLMAQQNGGGKTDASVLIRESMGAMREMLETAKSFSNPVYPYPPQIEPAYEADEEDEAAATGMTGTETGPRPSLADSLLADFGELFRGSAKRMMGTALATSEEKMSSTLSPALGGQAAPALQPASAPVIPAPASASVTSQSNVIGEIIEAVDQSITRKLPAERLVSAICENLPRPIVENLATITPPVFGELLNQMGHPEASVRFQRPEYVQFLTEVIALLRKKIGLTAPAENPSPSVTPPPAPQT